MKLSGVKIHNFRGILDQEIILRDYSLLVGPNNAGKSSAIDAIRAFYEKDLKWKEQSDFPHIGTADKESWVEMTFSLTDEEFDTLADEYKGSTKLLRVRKYFQTSVKTKDGKAASGSIFGYLGDGELSKDPFYGAKNVQSGKFGDLIYIPAISKVDDHAKLSGPSALRDLLTDIMTDVVEGGKAYGDFAASVQSFSQSIRGEETADQRSLAGFEKDLNALLNPWDATFELKFPPPSAAEIIKSMLGWDLMDQFHGKAQGVDSYGSGFQRHFIYSLIHLGSRYIGKKASKKAKDFTPTLNLVLFEEPEAFLHPPQQDALSRDLREMASKANWQVVAATHSSHFVSKSSHDIPAIIRLRRNNGMVELFQITEKDWSDLVDENQVVSDAAKFPLLSKKVKEDDAKPEMEVVKHFLWLNPDRAGLFFAKMVLLVEGPSEVALIHKLIGDGRLAAPMGLYVMDCIGKYNIHRFMNLLGRLGIPHGVIFDDDDNKDEHKELNRLVCDSRTAMTIGLEMLPGNLEKVLGAVPAGRPDRKPQSLLFQYVSGKLDVAKINGFCGTLGKCIGAAVPTVPEGQA